MKKTTRPITTAFVVVVLMHTTTANAQQTRAERIDEMTGLFEVSFGFGEIPFLSGSFKPSVGLSYHLNRYVSFGFLMQLRDVLERGTESFNARNTGLGGIESTREQTGVRALLAVRIRPHRYAPFLTVGALFNGSDTEVMRFDDRQRTIGGHDYAGTMMVEQTRRWAIRPAIGAGYAFMFDRGISLSLEMAGAFFMRPSDPDIRIESDAALREEDEAALRREMRREFRGNFHNRYHLFNMAVGYAW